MQPPLIRQIVVQKEHRQHSRLAQTPHDHIPLLLAQRAQVERVAEAAEREQRGYLIHEVRSQGREERVHELHAFYAGEGFLAGLDGLQPVPPGFEAVVEVFVLGYVGVHEALFACAFLELGEEEGFFAVVVRGEANVARETVV